LLEEGFCDGFWVLWRIEGFKRMSEKKGIWRI